MEGKHDLRTAYKNLPRALATMGFSGMREGQTEVVTSILSGRDTICVLPTGTGKSACFVLPALAANMRTLVFEPTVSLIQDQVDSLSRKGIDVAGVSGLQSETLNKVAFDRWIRGDLQFLYVAPERLGNARFKEAMRAVVPDMVVVDEVHCVSQWSDNFRPSYAHVGDFVREYQPDVVAAFTATFMPEIEQDVRDKLCMEDAVRLVYYPRRTNLKLTSRDMNSDYDLSEAVAETEGSTIVYCATRKGTVDTAAFLSHRMGEEVGFYHGDLPNDVKSTNQRLFMAGTHRIICATCAFGMGIDKPDIRSVIHRDMPGSIEQLSQEIGRAGRDGNDSRCLTFYHADAANTQRYLISCSYPDEQDVRRVFSALKNGASSSGEIRMTGRDIAARAGIMDRQVGASAALLEANNVIESIPDPARPCLIVIEEEPSGEDPRYDEYVEACRNLGTPRGEAGNTYEVSLRDLSEEVGKGEPTIRRWLKDWDTDNKIRYTKPYAGSVRKICGTLSDVDFERFRVKGRMAYEKLDQVLGYHDVADEGKHTYIESCFGFDTGDGDS